MDNLDQYSWLQTPSQNRHLQNCFHSKTVQYSIKLFIHGENFDSNLSTGDIIARITAAMHSNVTASACASEIGACIHYAIFSPTPGESRDEAYMEGKNGELRFTNKARD